ncbi:MAG TPA: porin family protein [Pontibacter sp.]
MKKLLLSLGLVFMAAGATMAQEQGKIRLGAGVVYGTESAIGDDGEAKGGIGFTVGGEYFITDKISAAPSYTYFLKSKIDFLDSKMTARASTIDLDGRYYFGNGNVAFYGLGGISIASAKVEIEDSEFIDGDSDSDSKAGINIGAGLVYPISDKMGLNAQIKYNTPLEQLAIQAGITFSIN